MPAVDTDFFTTGEDGQSLLNFGSLKGMSVAEISDRYLRLIAVSDCFSSVHEEVLGEINKRIDIGAYDEDVWSNYDQTQEDELQEWRDKGYILLHPCSRGDYCHKCHAWVSRQGEPSQCECGSLVQDMFKLIPLPDGSEEPISLFHGAR